LLTEANSLAGRDTLWRVLLNGGGRKPPPVGRAWPSGALKSCHVMMPTQATPPRNINTASVPAIAVMVPIEAPCCVC
jgi:hypothetical protein